MSCSECRDGASCCASCCDCHADGYAAGHAAAINGSDWATEDNAALERVAKLIRDSNDNPDLARGGSVAGFLEQMAAARKETASG